MRPQQFVSTYLNDEIITLASPSPPSGPAGGELAGTYPNPLFAHGDTSILTGVRFGVNSAVSPFNSCTAIGESALATAGSGTALGYFANASGVGAGTALGADTVATGLRTTAVGASASATGPNGTSLGFLTVCSSSNGLAAGPQASATGGECTALGSAAAASATGCIACGRQAAASQNDAIAIGRLSVGNIQDGIAIGRQATSNGIAGSISIGPGASPASTSRAFALSVNTASVTATGDLGATHCLGVTINGFTYRILMTNA